MRILMIHNYYGTAAPSGENEAFRLERDLLASKGHEVIEFVRHSDEIRRKRAWGMLKGAVSTPWNPFSAAAVRKVVEEYQPQVVHVHNTFPLLSPAVFFAVGHSAARVLTLHNYRIFCAAAVPVREGRVCMSCIKEKSVVPALRHGCYRGSRLATLPLAAKVALHRRLGTWERQVEAFITLTQFQKEQMIKAGLSEDLLHTKPNFYPGDPPVIPWNERDSSVVFAGRISAEKGVKTLVDAWRMWGESAPELRILGDGALAEELKRVVERERMTKVCFLGQLEKEAVRREIGSARLLVLPSECFEGFPMVIREAFALGTPVAVSNIGPLPSIVRDGKNGVIFNSSDSGSLLEVVRGAWVSPEQLERMGKQARIAFERHYTGEINYNRLMAIYERALSEKRRRGGG